MDKETVVSIKSLKENIPFNDDTLQYFVLFGSRINNTARNDSSLNMFYVSDEPMKIYEKITDIACVSDGVKDISMLAFTPKTFEDNVNLYGTSEYNTMRNIHPKYVLYKSKSFNEDDIIKEPDLKKNAEKWIYHARTEIPLVKKLGYEFACGFMFIVVDYSLRAYLLHQNVKFPFTRNLKILYDLIPDKTCFELDVDFIQINNWRKKNIKHTMEENVNSVSIAEEIYEKVKKLIDYNLEEE